MSTLNEYSLLEEKGVKEKKEKKGFVQAGFELGTINRGTQ